MQSNPYLAHKLERNSSKQSYQNKRKHLSLQDNKAESESYQFNSSHKNSISDNLNQKTKSKPQFSNSKPSSAITSKQYHSKFIFGNYSNYYSKRTPVSTSAPESDDYEFYFSDPRLNLFEKSWFSNKSCLDIGCNSGFITLGIAARFSPAIIEGVDIDPILIREARRLKNWQASLVEPLESLNDSSRAQLHHFPLSAALLHKHLDPPVDAKSAFPYNTQFRCSEWVNEPLPTNPDQYDTILALSITKWIHLSFGDTGLQLFFQKVFKNLKSGGKFILEPQMNGYGKRAKLARDMKMHYKEMKMMPEDFENYLMAEVGFQSVQKLTGNLGTEETDDEDQQGEGIAKSQYFVVKKFNRPIFVYTK
ncbi:hypothetical protein HK098_003315 [Nowakowskiella sp. JEL0407]|nr:hypothetical protein HK098_003315 [Nowakowskiella sp. JEL0407]